MVATLALSPNLCPTYFPREIYNHWRAKNCFHINPQLNMIF